MKDVGLKDSWNMALKNLRKPSDGPPKHKAGWQMILSTRAAEIGELLETEVSLPENEGKMLERECHWNSNVPAELPDSRSLCTVHASSRFTRKVEL